ncbi:hypothetical protein P7K49_005018, partial [Saguinus oedipus]
LEETPFPAAPTGDQCAEYTPCPPCCSTQVSPQKLEQSSSLPTAVLQQQKGGGSALDLVPGPT